MNWKKGNYINYFNQITRYLINSFEIIRKRGIVAAFQTFQVKYQTGFQRINTPLSVKDWLSYYESRVEIVQPLKNNNNLDNVTFPKVSIITLTFNNLAFSQLCLRSIYCNTTYPNYEVIVVDNASTDETPTWLKSYSGAHPNLKLILNSDNIGFAGGNNQAVREATGEYLVFLNNDTVVTQGWIERLLAQFQSDPAIGLVGPVTNATGNEALIPVSYTTPAEMEAFAHDCAITMSMRSFDIRMLAFYCVMTRRDQYENMGGLDERYAVGMFEDDDLAIRYHQKGLRVVCAEDVFIHHFQRVSFSKIEAEKYNRIFEENRKKYEDKWGRKWQPYKLRMLSLVDTKKINSELIVTNWGPRSTEQGKPVNVQPSGKSAIWIEVTGLSDSPGIKVLFGGKPMEDICIHDHGINAAIPTSYLSDIGVQDVVIKDHHSGRTILVGEFNIIPAAKAVPEISRTSNPGLY
jgi:GT2 family glycosyltransferase